MITLTHPRHPWPWMLTLQACFVCNGALLIRYVSPLDETPDNLAPVLRHSRKKSGRKQYNSAGQLRPSLSRLGLNIYV